MKSAFKKIVSSLLALILIFSTVNTIPLTADAVSKESTYTNSNYCTIKFDPMGGSVYPKTRECIKGAALVIPRATGKAGYELLGWSKVYGATKADYEVGDIIYPESDITLYAVWKVIEYKITLHYETNYAVKDDTYIVKYGEKFTFPDDYPTKSGYEFSHWEDGNGKSHQPGNYFIPKYSQTVYAQWSNDSYFIRYYDDYATLRVTAQKVPDIGYATIDKEPTIREGYDFLYWKDMDSYYVKDRYELGTTYTGGKSLKLEPVYGTAKYTFTFDSNGGEDVQSEQTVVHNYLFRFSSVTIPTRTGYKFLGWSEDKNATTAEYKWESSIYASSDRIFYAVWELGNYTVSYDCLGGEPQFDSQTSTYDSPLYIPLDTPVREGYSFLGWADSADAVETMYQAGDEFYISKNTTMYAVWKPDEYTVLYDANGGEGVPDSQIKYYGIDLAISDIVPVKEGYTFCGWSTDSKATEAEYNSQGIYSENESITLYAVWSINEYKIEYDANGGEGAPSSQIKYHGTDITLSDIVPTREGHTFLGWATDSTATESEYNTGDTFTLDGNTILYAVWIANNYTLSYNANGGENAPESQTNSYGSNLIISGAVPTREGHTFLGWATDSTATKVEYVAGNSFTLKTDSTLYAVWSINQYTIIYNANGGKNPPASQTKIHGEDLKISYTVPTREHYDFIGWATDRTATEVEYTSGDTFKLDQNTTLYAVWDAHKYTVKFDANGGSGVPASLQQDFNLNLTLPLTEPYRDGSTFLGWSESMIADVATYKPGAVFTKKTTTTLYAVWKVNSYTLTYDTNGGSEAPASQKVLYGYSTKISLVMPTREGYTFLGWSENSTATEATYVRGDIIRIYKDTVLYAVWKPDEYTVSYDANGGEGAPGSQIKYYDTYLVISEDIPTKEGFVFLGWSANSDATKADYNPEEIYSNNESVTLYAVWEELRVTLSFDANGGYNVPASRTVLYGTEITLNDTPPNKPCYWFMGWSESKNATEATYQKGDTFTIKADTTLYAVWHRIYTLGYNANGGENAPRDQIRIGYRDFIISSSVPTREGYTFLGWSTDRNATEAEYIPGDTIISNADATTLYYTTLYAVWAKDGEDYLLGDVDLNGIVNVKDATEIQKYLAYMVTLSDVALYQADFDQNGIVNVKDATAIQKFLAGLSY